MLNKNASYFVISDAHVGSRSSIDICNYKKLIPFIEDVYDNTNAVLILNGDFYEFEKAKKKKVFFKNQEIETLLKKLETENRLIRLRGNHDEGCGLDRYIIDNKYLVIHGDVFEKTSSINPALTSLIHTGVAFAERLFKTNIDKILENILGYDRKKCRSIKIKEKACEYIKMHTEYEAIIVGHSHVAYKCEKYYNCGCFTEDNSDYIEVTDEKIELKKY
jgi:UDP-2,3-diacylglucosamine pyrophosphatase LpxH